MVRLRFVVSHPFDKKRRMDGAREISGSKFYYSGGIYGRLGSLLFEDFNAGSGVGLGCADELGRADDRATGNCLLAIGDEEGSSAGSSCVPTISRAGGLIPG